MCSSQSVHVLSDLLVGPCTFSTVTRSVYGIHRGRGKPVASHVPRASVPRASSADPLILSHTARTLCTSTSKAASNSSHVQKGKKCS